MFGANPTSAIRSKMIEADLQQFCVPHVVVDELFPPDVLRLIDEHWPEPEFFQPEVPGNYLFHMYSNVYGEMRQDSAAFWRYFNRDLYPVVMASLSETYHPILSSVFGDLVDEHLYLDYPLTLMQVDDAFNGHLMHTHHYHCPHWAFTTLIYIDRADEKSKGTTLYSIASTRPDQIDERIFGSNYVSTNIEKSADYAMYNVNLGEVAADCEKKDVDYEYNRLFSFLDGPLALHGVEAGTNEGQKRRMRRILRTHSKIHHVPFYNLLPKRIGSEVDPEAYMRMMNPAAQLDQGEQVFRDSVLRDFHLDQLNRYREAVLNGGTGVGNSNIYKSALRRFRNHIP